MRRAFAVLFGSITLVLACQVLPSAVPLANSGAPLEDTGTERDKQPQDDVESETALTASKPAPPPSARPAPPPVEASADAGTPGAVVATADAGTTSITWAGEYYGSDRLVRHFDGEPDAVELDDKAHTRIEQTGSSALTLSIVNSATSEVICALHATIDGTSATLDDDQSCFGDDGSTSTITGGHVTVTSDRLVLDFNATVVADTGDDNDGTDGTDDDSVEFHLDYHFDGRRR